MLPILLVNFYSTEHRARSTRDIFAPSSSKVRTERRPSLLGTHVLSDDDHHLPALTVRETLRFAAILKLPHTISRKRKFARAEEVLRMLGLQNCADNMVGGELLKGISGGEKRRLSLACQMVSRTFYMVELQCLAGSMQIDDPPILIADEPVSTIYYVGWCPR